MGAGRWGSGAPESERFVVLPPSGEGSALPDGPDDPTQEDDPLPLGPPGVFDSAPEAPSQEEAKLSDSDLGAFGAISSDGDDLSALAAEAIAGAREPFGSASRPEESGDEVETGFGFDYGSGKMLSETLPFRPTLPDPPASTLAAKSERGSNFMPPAPVRNPTPKP